MTISFELRNKGSSVEIFDSETHETFFTLTTDQAWAFYHWWNDGICPVCANDINVGQVICDSCFTEAERFPPRADALAARQQRQPQAQGRE